MKFLILNYQNLKQYIKKLGAKFFGIPAVYKTLRSYFNSFGIRFVRIPVELRSLDLYEEKERPEKPRYLNIGAGGFYHPFWHNLNLPGAEEAVHIAHDLMSGKRLPIESNTLKVAYTSHVIEHLSDRAVRYLFEEVYRCLRPGGFFRIVSPDLDLEYDAYLRRDALFWWWENPEVSIEQRFLDHFASPLSLKHPEVPCKKYSDEEIQSIFTDMGKEQALDFFVSQIPVHVKGKYPSHHINWFNKTKLMAMLMQSGFNDIWESRMGQSRCVFLRDIAKFDHSHFEFSLYIECRKLEGKP